MSTDRAKNDVGLLETVSVVLPTRNRLPLLRDALKPLLAEPRLHEIIVVDDGSTDGTAAWLEREAESHPALRTISTPGIGPGTSRRLGAYEATGDIVLLIDDDIVAVSDIIGGHLRHHREQSEVLVCGYNPVVCSRGAPATVRFYARLYEEWADSVVVDPQTCIVDTRGGLFYLWASQFSVRRSDLDETLLSVPEFYEITRQDDHELSLRWHEAGRRFVFDRSLRAEHRYSRTVDQFARDNWGHGRGRIVVYMLHRDLLGPLPRDIYERPGRGRAFALVLRATDREAIYEAATAFFKTAARVSDRLRLRRLAELWLRLLALVEQRRGAREQLARMPSLVAVATGIRFKHDLR